MSRAAIACLALAALLAATPAAADDVAAARAQFRKGAELYRARQYRDAIAAFESAYRLKPHGAIHFNVAQCREKLEQWPGALRSYTDYLREVPDASDRAAVRAAIGRLEARLAAAGVQALLVYSDPPGAEVRLDGRARGRTPFLIVLPPGTYALALALDGYAGVEQEVTVGGRSRVVDQVLRAAEPAKAASPMGAAATPSPTAAPPPTGAPTPAPRGPAAAKPDLSARPLAETLPPAAPERPREKRRVYTWVAAGTAVAAATAGAYLGYTARQKSDALLDGNAHPDARSLARDAESRARAANVLYAVSGAAAAAGATLFLVEGRF
jgi:hypothetical protein